MGLLDVLREVVILTENVKRLQNDFEALLERVEENRERIIKLEAREEILDTKISQKVAEEVNENRLDIDRRLSDFESHVIKKVDSREVSQFILPEEKQGTESDSQNKK